MRAASSSALVFVVVLTLLQTAVFAQDAPLQVGVSELPPFAFQTDGQWDGVAVTLWREVADDLGLGFEFTATEPDALVGAVADGTLDLGLTGTATAEAEARADFSYPYYTTTLSVATPRAQSLWNTLKGLFTARFFRVVLFLSVLLLVVGTLVWLLERGGNEDFGGEHSALQGVGAGFWWAAVTMTTIGYGDKAPATFWGRALAFLWMLLAMGITASLTAALVSVVGAGAGGSLSVPSDLRGTKVGVVADTPAASYLEGEGIGFRAFGTPLAGLRALQQGDLDAFLASDATLRYLKSENSSLTFQRTETNTRPQRYAFVLPQADAQTSPSRDLNREDLNRVLLTRLNAQPWGRLLERYLPNE